MGLLKKREGPFPHLSLAVPEELLSPRKMTWSGVSGGSDPEGGDAVDATGQQGQMGGGGAVAAAVAVVDAAGSQQR